MAQDEFDAKGHLSEERLALLAQSGAESAAPDALIEHLAACRRCFAIYAEFAQLRLAWLSGVPQAAPRQRRRLRRIWIGAAAVAALALFWIAGQQRSATEGPALGVHYPVLTEALTAASSEQLIYPGSEAGALQRSPTYRSGSLAVDIQPALDSLLAEFRRGDADETSLYWLSAGYLVAGQMENAASFLREARQRFPQSDRLEILAAIHAYRVDRSYESIRILDAVVQRSPQDDVALFNLGFVLAEEGDARGLQLLDQVAGSQADNALGRRAAAELGRLRQ